MPVTEPFVSAGDLPDGFPEVLGARFGFDSLHFDIGSELGRIARRYQRDLTLFDDAAQRGEERQNYRHLGKQVQDLRTLLAEPDFEALGSELYLYLRTHAQGSGHDLIRLPTVPNSSAGEHLLKTLDNLLELVSSAAEETQIRNALPKGRKPDYPLECLVRNIACLWSDILHRPFTLDYHKGSGLTEAFDFVKSIVGVIAPEVPENRLITIMRTIIAERNFVPPTK